MKENKTPRQELICCCESQKQFSIPAEILDNLIVNCPYCENQMRVDFKPVPAQKDILRGGHQAITKETLPDLIKTKPL